MLLLTSSVKQSSQQQLAQRLVILSATYKTSTPVEADVFLSSLNGVEMQPIHSRKLGFNQSQKPTTLIENTAALYFVSHIPLCSAAVTAD
jgi:hypothetical protein